MYPVWNSFKYRNICLTCLKICGHAVRIPLHLNMKRLLFGNIPSPSKKFSENWIYSSEFNRTFILTKRCILYLAQILVSNPVQLMDVMLLFHLICYKPHFSNFWFSGLTHQCTIHGWVHMPLLWHLPNSLGQTIGLA